MLTPFNEQATFVKKHNQRKYKRPRNYRNNRESLRTEYMCGEMIKM